MNKKSWIYLIIFLISMLAIGFVGLVTKFGRSFEELKFLFENMVWFPVEIIFTIVVIEKALEKIEKNNQQKRFTRLARQKNEKVLKRLKNSVVEIVLPIEVYDPLRKTDDELFREIMSNINNYITPELTSATRTLNFADTGPLSVNFMGVTLHYCGTNNIILDDYFEKLGHIMPDEIYEFAIEIVSTNSILGALDFPSMELHRANGLKDPEGSMIIKYKKFAIAVQNLEKALSKMNCK